MEPLGRDPQEPLGLWALEDSGVGRCGAHSMLVVTIMVQCYSMPWHGVLSSDPR